LKNKVKPLSWTRFWFILTVDESREQTRTIQAMQRERETEAGLRN
jgi:hypothetical protein